VCVCVRAPKGKWVELSTPNLVDIWQSLGKHWLWSQKVKGYQMRCHQED